MKKVALFFLLLTGVGFADNLHWLGDYNRALQKAELNHKPLLLLVLNKGRNSTRILKTCFAKETVAEAVNSKTVPVMVLFEGQNSYPIEMFYTTVFPTLFIINSKDERLISNPLYGKEIKEKSVLKLLKGSSDNR